MVKNVRGFSLTVIVIAAVLFGSSGCKESPETALPRLEKQLEARDSSTRNRAALALAGYGPSAAPAVPALIRALQDENGGVRSSAAFALRSIGTPEAQKGLDGYRK